MKQILCLFSFLMFVCACSEDSYDGYFQNVGRYESFSDSQGVEISLPWYMKLQSVEAFEMDSLCNKGKSESLSIEHRKSDYAYFSKETLNSKYLLIQATNAVDEKHDTAIVFEYLVDPSVYLRFSTLDLCSHVVQKRVIKLIRDGYPYVTAQALAQKELKTQMGGQSCENSVLEKLLYSNSENKYEIEAFRDDFLDGIIDDFIVFSDSSHLK